MIEASLTETTDGYESTLVRHAVEGRAAAVDAICRLHQPRVKRLVRRFLGRDPDVEDVIQEVFRHVCKSLPRFRGASSLASWIHRVALNTCRTHVRTRRRRNDRQTLVEGPEAHPTLCRSSADPADISAERERFRDVLAAVDRLPPSHRAVVVLGPIQGHSHETIAEILHTSTDAVKGRLHRARQAMLRLLGVPQPEAAPPRSLQRVPGGWTAGCADQPAAAFSSRAPLTPPLDDR